MTGGNRVLVVDDKDNIRRLLRRVLEEEFEIHEAADGAEAIARLGGDAFDVVVTDLRLPKSDGMTVLRQSKKEHPDTEVVLMTAYGSVENAIAAIKEGAYDYLTKPFDPDHALVVIRRAAERKSLRDQARDLRSALSGAQRFENIVGTSPAMRTVFDQMRRAAASDATLLVVGESGTGKELVAQAVHAVSARRDRRFVAVNCGALPQELMESELFGHMRGAFTGAFADKRGLFEAAAGGTLFLDEVGELPIGLQVKLTRALQERAVRALGSDRERPVDVRIIAATNVDLEVRVAEERFREDLFFRLNVLRIALPPLRDRREDIPPLAGLFLQKHGAQHEPPLTGFSGEALSALVRHDWPGNVRELENTIERAVLQCDDPQIDVDSLQLEVKTGRTGRAPSTALNYRQAMEVARDRASRDYLVALLGEIGGNVTHAAERAGMERESLHRLLRKHGLKSEAFKR